MNCLGQQFPNSGFEDWHINEDGIEDHPEFWMDIDLATFCNPVLNFCTPSNDAHSGMFSALLETNNCIDESWVQNTRRAYMRTGTNGVGIYPPLGMAITYGDRPDTMSFFYKFLPQGTDSGYVRVFLFTYDEVETEVIDTIALSELPILASSEFQQFQLPLNYLDSGWPEYISIYFSTSWTLEHEGTIYAPNGVYASAGTRLWIDDISFHGGTVTASEIETSEPIIHYQPKSESFIFNNNHYMNGSLQVHDCAGRIVQELQILNDNVRCILPTGLWIVRFTDQHSLRRETLKVLVD
jgi:hypothetical protein